MKLVALKAVPMVPWFDEPSTFNEVGIFNMEEKGVFVVAKYFGEKEWTNELDPEFILETHAPKILTLNIPPVVDVGQAFEISGTYRNDGEYIIFIDSLPIKILVQQGVFSKQISINYAGVFTVSSKDVIVEAKQIIVSM